MIHTHTKYHNNSSPLNMPININNIIRINYIKSELIKTIHNFKKETKNR